MADDDEFPEEDIEAYGIMYGQQPPLQDEETGEDYWPRIRLNWKGA